MDSVGRETPPCTIGDVQVERVVRRVILFEVVVEEAMGCRPCRAYCARVDDAGRV